MQFQELLSDVAHTLHGDGSVAVAGIAYDSRRVEPGFVFVAIKGVHTDGHGYIPTALAQGAVAIVYDDPAQPPPAEVPSALVENAKVALSALAAAWYGYPAHALDVVGITGTKGKTTTTFLTAAVLEASGSAVGFMSTVDFKIAGQQWANKTRQSTPEALEVQAMLRDMVDAGCRYAVVESTSHALSPRWNRLGDCAFDAAVITNITHEHLDYHGSFEQYRNDKAELFRLLAASPATKTIHGHAEQPRKVAIVNADDPNAHFFLSAAGAGVEHLTYAVNAPADVRATNIIATSRGLQFTVETPVGAYDLQLQLVGQFYVYNVLAALSVGLARGVDLAAAIKRLEVISGINGRMDQVLQGQPFSVLIDYAHNPDSFEQVMGMMRPLTTGRMIAVFGSAGERDREKRALQGAIAARWCDYIILTDEDPRGEDRMTILEAIAMGVEEGGKRDACQLIPDRRAAIRAALQMAQAGDIVLLLGKGHEGSIIYADGDIAWDERAVACAELAALGYSATP